MVTEASELLDHIHGTACQKILNSPVLEIYLKTLWKIGSGLNVNVSCASKYSLCIQNNY